MWLGGFCFKAKCRLLLHLVNRNCLDCFVDFLYSKTDLEACDLVSVIFNLKGDTFCFVQWGFVLGVLLE